MDPEVRRILTTILLNELASIRPLMEEVMIANTAQSFTLPEIEALVIFYNSPEVVAFYSSLEGASAMAKMSSFVALTSRNMAPEFTQMQLNVLQRLQSEMGK